jgi:uncharacterized ubiquitin-like protein YukD
MIGRIILAGALSLALVLPAFAEKLTVKTLTGKDIAVEIGLGETVAKLKQLITDKEGLPAEQQRIIWAGKQLEDEKKLSDYSITDGSTVMLVLRLRGG